MAMAAAGVGMKRGLSLGAAIAEAVAFVPKAWVGAWGALALAVGLFAAPLWIPADRLHSPWILTGLIIVALVVGLAAEGALYRLGVSAGLAEARRRGLGIGGLQLGKPELRLVAGGLMTAGFVAMVAAAGAVVVSFLANALGVDLRDLPRAPAANLAEADWRSGLVWAAIAGASWAALHLAVRLSLFKAATVARGTLVTLDAMSLAQGRFWSLLAGLVIILIPSFALAFAHHSHALTGLDHRTWVLLHAGVMAGVQAPLLIGFLCSAYKRVEYWTLD